MRDLSDLNITDASGGSAITVKVVPKANKSEIVGVQEDGTLKVHLMSPPVDDQENEELIMVLSDFLGCRPSDIEILAQSDRKKLISIVNVEPGQMEALLRESHIGFEGEE